MSKDDDFNLMIEDCDEIMSNASSDAMQHLHNSHFHEEFNPDPNYVPLEGQY
eukprot:CAMPEP_0194395402 /NCGR_PEP_ID=MMETSP0174-20130528/124404_1 /TAXON_ID=216777 /ORGANISM="Proboscia alata, Strain PI-D3" /LENGTH=51 /DNA_ID=CAMNT_0039191335 /DNA_START=98 /DNA_END=253 /DNA_ORIENTATION=-